MSDTDRWKNGYEAAAEAQINSPHNACMFRENCRKAAAEIARLRSSATETDRIKRPVLNAAQWHGGKWGTVVPAEFASKLERERDAMQAEIARLREELKQYLNEATK